MEAKTRICPDCGTSHDCLSPDELAELAGRRAERAEYWAAVEAQLRAEGKIPAAG